METLLDGDLEAFLDVEAIALFDNGSKSTPSASNGDSIAGESLISEKRRERLQRWKQRKVSRRDAKGRRSKSSKKGTLSRSQMPPRATVSVQSCLKVH